MVSRADTAAVTVATEQERLRDSRVWNKSHMADSRWRGCEDDTAVTLCFFVKNKPLSYSVSAN